MAKMYMGAKTKLDKTKELRRKIRMPATERVVRCYDGKIDYWTTPSENGEWYVSCSPLEANTQEGFARDYSRLGGLYVRGMPNEFVVTSMPNYMELFGDLQALISKSNEAEKQRAFIENLMRIGFPLTLTIIGYMSLGKGKERDKIKDKIIHNWNTEDEYTRRADFDGKEGRIREVLGKKDCLALTGMSINRAEDIMGFINRTSKEEVYILGIEPRQDKYFERVARFSANSFGTGFICIRYPTDSSALGVRRKNLGLK